MINKIGVIGYSSGDFDELLAKRYIIKGFQTLMKKDMKNWVVSGYTDIGIPGIAYRVGKKLDFKTIGFSAKEALKYKLYPVDKKIIVGEKFGDESKAFLKYIDCLLKVGGGKQSQIEYNLFIKHYPNKPFVSYKLDRK